jgi:hypothetical protein
MILFGNSVDGLFWLKNYFTKITKQYHISETDLRKLNPELDSHLRIGDEVTLPSDNVKKYADKNAFNRNFAAPQEVKPAESVAVSTPVETPKADEGQGNRYKVPRSGGAV